MTKNRVAGVRSVVGLGRALASPARVRALAALRSRELCLCEVSELLGTAPSTTSAHMSLLAGVGLVEARRAGRWTYYSRPEEPAEEIAGALALVDSLAARDPVVREDSHRIRTLACR